MSEIIRDFVKFMKGRKKIVDEPITFSQAVEILKKSKPQEGINTDIRGYKGARSVRYNQSTKEAYESLCAFFCEVEKPDFYTKFEGKYVVYAGKGEQLHYLDLKNKRGLPGGIATDDQKGIFSFITPLKEDSNQEKKEDSDLVNKLSVVVGIGGFILSIFFISSNLTGNVISNLNQTALISLGVIFFVLGLIGSFFYFIRNKNY